VEWLKGGDGKMLMQENKDSIRQIDAGLVLLAMGFVHPVHEGLLDSLGLEYSERGNVRVNKTHQTTRDKVFATGDTILGASLVVSAIMSGRRAAVSIMEYLAGTGSGK
jgi:glutamate synthase (NADPH) small chain